MGRFDALTTLDTKPTETAPLPEKAVVSQTTKKPANIQTGLHANLQTSKDASKQARKPVNMQTGKPASKQTSKQVFIEKYSSYLQHEYKKELKRIALESDRKEYEVLIEAVEHYLEQRKHSK